MIDLIILKFNQRINKLRIIYIDHIQHEYSFEFFFGVVDLKLDINDHYHME